MARSKLTETSDDLISDSGAVLWSFVRGEQLEYPVSLNFLSTVSNYQFEAVVIEAENLEFQTSRPLTALAGGVQTVLNVRLPVDRGNWQDVQAYNRAEVVTYGGKRYALVTGVAYVSSVTPDLDPAWEETSTNLIYLQFPSSLGANYAVSAAVGSPVYGFFELRVTEPPSNSFRRTWKPIRGMVELLFSPTDVVPDV